MLIFVDVDQFNVDSDQHWADSDVDVDLLTLIASGMRIQSNRMLIQIGMLILGLNQLKFMLDLIMVKLINMIQTN